MFISLNWNIKQKRAKIIIDVAMIQKDGLSKMLKKKFLQTWLNALK